MANEIDVIASKNALAGLEDLIKKLDVADRLLIKAASDALALSQNVSKVTTPSGLAENSVNNNNASANVKQEAEWTKKLANEINNLDKARKKYNQTRTSGVKATIQERTDAQIFLQNEKLKARAISEEADAYQKLSAELAIAQKRAQAIGATWGADSVQFKKASDSVRKLDDEIKKIDAGIGKHTRNVGNYASGYNALGNSINQLTREAPAFANSINTGFMALSNNFPALFDAITGIREQNKLLIAEGKPTKSLFAQLVSGIFSWQTALSLGVTLLTLYGGTIIKWISNLGNASSKLTAVQRAQESLNRAQAEADKNTSDEITHLQLLASTAEDLALPMESRKRAVKEMQELYPHYLGNLSQEAILAGETSDQMKELAKNIMAAAVARGIEEEISKKAQSDYKERKLLIGEINTDLQNYQKVLRSFDKVTNKEQKEAYLLNAKVQFEQTRQRKLAALKALTDQQDAENEILIRGYKKQVELTGKLGPDGKDEEDRKNKVKKERREDIEGLESHLKTVGTLKDEIDAEINRLTTESITGDKEALPAINFQLELLIKLRKQLNDLPEADVKIVNNVKKTTVAIRELTEETKKYLKSFVDDFSSNAGFKNLVDSFDLNNSNSLFNKIKEGTAFTKENWQASTVDIMESAQEMYNFISNASQANFDAEKKRVEDQYNIALRFAGDNKEAQDKLGQDLERSKKDIANREAKAKQKQAIFNIIIDTAQAVVAALPNYILAGVVAALGAAQIAVVSSQQIPQYWMGGEHDGGKMMINDGSGSNWKETFVTPDGKAHQATGKNAIVDAPKGTKIYTHDQWLEHQKEVSLNNMLSSNNIDRYIPVSQQKGMTKEDFYEVMGNTLGRQTIERSNLDARGFSKYTIKRGNSITRSLNRANGKA